MILEFTEGFREELFGDREVVDSLMSRCRRSVQWFKFSPRLDFEMVILEDALPDYDLLDQLKELCV